jgi:hypothetical protein
VGLTELQQVNAIIALSKRIVGWPSTLADYGYTLDRIELKIKVSDSSAPGISKVVNPDLLFVADTRNFSLLVELKSGTFNHHALEQVNSLERITPKELVLFGRVSLQTASNVFSHQISSMMIINQEHLDEYLGGFENALSKATLVSISVDLIKSHFGEMADTPLDAEFKRGIDTSQSYLPAKLIRVLPTTNDTGELINSVVNTVMELWVKNERSVTPLRIAERLFTNEWGSFWSLFDTDAQKRFLDVAQDTLKDMNQTEFNRYLGSIPGVRNEWRLLKLPEAEGKNQTKAYQAFQRAAQHYKWRRQNGVEFENRYFDQPTFAEIEGFFGKDGLK